MSVSAASKSFKRKCSTSTLKCVCETQSCAAASRAFRHGALSLEMRVFRSMTYTIGLSEPEEGNLKSDESCISNPKLDNCRSDCECCEVRFEISNFGFEMQDSSDFKFPM